jgi:membrane protease YdiL (CAAX protease family)
VTSTPTAPGWYPDPWRQAWWRWWDGASWTAYTDQWAVPAAPAPAEPRLRAGGIAILGFVAGIVLSIAIDVVLWILGFSATDPAVLLGSSIGLWIGLGGACVIAVRRKGTGSLADLGLVRPRWVDVGMGLGLGIASLIAVGFIAVALEAISSDLVPSGRSDLGDPIKHGGALGIIVVYLIAVVGAPFFEELYFRGLVQGTLSARWGVGVGIVVQAMLFGLVHLTPQAGWGNVGVFVIISSLGVALGLIRHSSHRLPPSMFTHAAYNAIIVSITVARFH